jgi:uridine kinase
VPKPINIIEGEISTIDKLISDYDLILYLKTSLFRQLKNRIRRDRNDRKYSLLKSLYVFIKSNLIDYKIYNGKAKSNADIIIKRTG